jgi:plastocyanin
MVSIKMKTGILITIGIISGIVILVTSTSIGIPTMEANHQQECHYDGGKVTGFLQCTRVHMDYAIEPTTVHINLGALDPQSENPIFPKEMTVLLGKNNTVTWLNTDGPSHFINFENWAIGPIHQGERKSITFNHTGVYEYFSVNSPSILGLIIVKSGLDRNELENFAVILAEINQNATIYQKNNNQEKFEKQLILMKEKQAEIASKILEVGISDAYVAEGWNYPFKESSEVTVFNPEFKKPLCNIPEKIPIHLQKIQRSEMFQMFAGKYSQHQLTIDISDERYGGGLVHYDLIAKSDDRSFTASTDFHLDSCTDEMKSPYFLFCKDTKSDEHIATRIKSEIISSLESNEFCNIKFEPWHQAIRDYQTKISDELRRLSQGEVPIDSDGVSSHKFFLDFQRLGLLNDIIRYYESENLDYEKIQEDVAEYNKKFGSLPDELLELIKKRK